MPSLVVNVPGVTTFALIRRPQASDGWAEWSSYGRTTFRGRCSVMSSGDVLVGDEVAGNVYTLASGVYSDNGDPVTFLASAFIRGANKAERCNNIVVQGARGVGLATGQGSDLSPNCAFRMTRAGHGPIGSKPLLGPWGNTRTAPYGNAWALCVSRAGCSKSAPRTPF